MAAQLPPQRLEMPQIGCLGCKSMGILMHATSPAVRLLLSLSCAMLAAPAVCEVTGVGPPAALAPGQAPPLPQAGPLAEPRSLDQVGFPTALTKYVISPTTLRPARVALGQKLFFEPRLSGDGSVACATCHDPARAFTDGRPVSVGIHGRVGQRNAPTILNALYSLTIKVPAAYFSADPERISRALKWRAAPVGSAADSCAKDAGSVPEL
jgi:hypothetical protein